jgi:3'-phosphoadenosine 5'-phosphosulfate sulfotransferase (PAPS reductase)/FAD synthetase
MASEGKNADRQEGDSTMRLEQKIEASRKLLMDFMDKADEPVLAFGAGRESCTIVGLMLAYPMTAGAFKDKVKVIISDTDSEGMALAQAALMKMLGFVWVEIGPGVRASAEGTRLGVFKVQPPYFGKGKGQGETMKVSTNWAAALISYEHIIVGMRKDDRPPRDQIVNYIGTEAWGTMGGLEEVQKMLQGQPFREKKHILFPLADWTSEDLDNYLQQGVGGTLGKRTKVAR